jgi:hypothetical protein
MKGVMQTKRGGPDVPPAERGDCLAACLASILEVPVAETAIDFETERHWWDEAQDAVGKHGYHLVIFDVNRGSPDVYWVATVPSRNLTDANGKPALHAIVMHDWTVAHDPCLGKRYEVGEPLPGDVEPSAGWVLVPRGHGHAGGAS